MSPYNVSHTLKHNFSCIFEELARFDVSRVYHGKRICDFWTPYQSRAILRCIRHPLARNVHAPHLSNFRVARYERSTIVIITPRTFNADLFLQRFNKIVATLFPRDIFFLHIQSGCLLHQITLHLLHFVSELPITNRECILLSFLYITSSDVTFFRRLLLHVLTCFTRFSDRWFYRRQISQNFEKGIGTDGHCCYWRRFLK